MLDRATIETALADFATPVAGLSLAACIETMNLDSETLHLELSLPIPANGSTITTPPMGGYIPIFPTLTLRTCSRPSKPRKRHFPFGQIVVRRSATAS